MDNKVQEQWAIVIDTDSYSGNFEREMGAYITGTETIRGERFVEDIRKHYGFNPKVRGSYWDDDERNPFANLFENWPGEHGDELAHIWPTPGWGNNGKGEHVQLSTLTAAKAKKCRWPAYQSVIIRCCQRPTQKQIQVLKEWAFKFSERSKAPKPEWKAEDQGTRDPFYFKPVVNIIGIRLLCDKTITETTEIDLGL